MYEGGGQENHLHSSLAMSKLCINPPITPCVNEGTGLVPLTPVLESAHDDSRGAGAKEGGCSVADVAAC